MPRPKLTPKQIKFIEAYSGNASEAARIAGYKGNVNTLKQVAAENLAKPYIAEAIRARQEKEISPIIATRQERQAFWSDVMNNPKVKFVNRLRASELLGKSQADFTDKTIVSGSLENTVKIVAYMPPNGRANSDDKKE